MLSSIRLASHVSESEEATRWRHERYGVRLSERGWGLLLGWLQGGGLAGSIEGTEARGRDRVLAIINERVKVDGQLWSSFVFGTEADACAIKNSPAWSSGEECDRLWPPVRLQPQAAHA